MGHQHLKNSFRITVHPSTPTELPDLLHSSHSCERCYVNKECMLVAASAKNDSRLPRSHGALLQHFTSHLNEIELEYFRDWDRLIDLEAHTSNHNITKAWLMSSLDREIYTGKCISSLLFTSDHERNLLIENVREGDKDSLEIRLERSPHSQLSTPFNALKFDIGSRIVLSSDGTSLYQVNEKHIFSILRGTIIDLKSNCVSIRVGSIDAMRISRIITSNKEEMRFRIDKDDFTVGTGTLRQNLMNLFTSDIPPFAGKLGLTQELLSSIHERTKTRLPWLRRLLVHLSPPTFDGIQLDSMFTPSSRRLKGCDITNLSKEFKELNSDQKAAIEKVRWIWNDQDNI